jgi:hypothetical protein
MVVKLRKNILRVFESRLLIRINRPKRDEVIAERRKLYEELYNLYCLLNISRMIISE